MELDVQRINEIDKGKVIKEYLGWPELAESATKVEVASFRDVDRIVVLGMGGSASAGDIAAGWAESENLCEVSVFKGSLPVRKFYRTLVISCSYSGNTRETIAMTEYAIKKGASVLAVSSGGRLAEIARKNGLEHVRIPLTLAPRYSLPFVLFYVARVIASCSSRRINQELAEAIESMKEVRKRSTPDAKNKDGGPFNLSEKVCKRIPKIYSTNVTRGVALRFKNSLNENAKRQACAETIPELFHNEVEAIDEIEKFLPIFLHHSSDETYKDRIHALKSLLGKRSEIISVSGTGSSSFSQLVSMNYFLEFVSYYTAILLGRDPLPTNNIDSLKRY